MQEMTARYKLILEVLVFDCTGFFILGSIFIDRQTKIS